LAALLWRLLARLAARRGLEAAARSFLRFAADSGDRNSSFDLAKRLLDADENREAAKLLESFLSRDPAQPRGWLMLGAARRRLGELEAAEEATRRALDLDPRYPEALSNLGEILLARGRPAEALALFEKALALSPHFVPASNNRIAALYELGRFEEAKAAADEAIEKNPDVPQLHVNLGNVLLHTARARKAVKAYKRALELDPSCVEAAYSLAMLYGETPSLGVFRDWLEREIATKGESAQRLAALALCRHAAGDIAGAEEAARRVLEMQPAHVAALMTLAGCVSARGDHLEAIRMHERILASWPDVPAAASNICFEATYVAELTAEEVHARHLDWARRFEAPRLARAYAHAPGADPEKRLRIGYVSGDFGYHPVGYLLRDVVRAHDHGRHEIHCFSMMRREDEITRAIREAADFWHDVLLDTDDEVAEKIRAEEIDILVDLSGHTAYTRLLALALRPAPVQATWIGYFHSTGASSIDYFITDPHTSPRGCGQLFSETPVWLAHSRFCYSPPHDAPPVSKLPCLARGEFTFGCFNRLEKLVPAVLEAWAEILQRVPRARLFLKGKGLAEGSERDWILAEFARRGVASERLELRDRSAHAQMLAEYGEVDLALDPFPFNGGMTTLEALWMGVPVLTLEGRGVVSRQSYAALANIGLTAELAAPTRNAYIERAVALANDPERLGELRGEIRPRLAASPICQPEQFTRDLERLYREMWRAGCEGRRLPSAIA